MNGDHEAVQGWYCKERRDEMEKHISAVEKCFEDIKKIAMKGLWVVLIGVLTFLGVQVCAHVFTINGGVTAVQVQKYVSDAIDKKWAYPVTPPVNP